MEKENDDWEMVVDQIQEDSKIPAKLETETPSPPPPPPLETHLLTKKWNLYYHLPDDKNWTVASYLPIMMQISTVEETLALVDQDLGLSDNMIKYAMLFLFRQGITPLWEDAQNRTGGAFSYKVLNKHVPEVWRELVCLLVGESLMVHPTKHHHLVNGITISPKKQFCIVKIWLRDCSLQDPAVITPIPLLMKNGSLFRKHEPEF